MDGTLTTSAFEVALSLVAGGGLGWIIRSSLVPREILMLKEQQAQSIDKVVQGAAAQLGEQRQSMAELREAWKEQHDERAEAWTREREAVQVMNTQLHAMVEQLQSRLLEKTQYTKVKVEADQVFPQDERSLRDKVDGLLGEAKNYGEQVARLVSGGFSRQEAEGYLAGELDIEDLPDGNQRLDRVLQDALSSATGVR